MDNNLPSAAPASTPAASTPASSSVSLPSQGRIPRGDLIGILVIGAAVGLLVQPILSNLIVPTTTVIRAGTFVIFLIGAPAALFIAKLISRAWAPVYQFAKFAAVGVLNSFVDLGVLNLEIFLLQPSTKLFPVIKAASFIVASVNSFFWNKHWTFGSHEKGSVGETVKFYIVTFGSFIVNIGVASLIVNLFSRQAAVTPAIANVAAVVGIAAALIVNFLGYKFFVFKDRTPKA